MRDIQNERSNVLTEVPDPARASFEIREAAALPADEVLRGLGVTAAGLSSAEATRRLARDGPNAVASHRARVLPVLWHQLRSPLLLLLLLAAAVSYFVGERADALIIAAIVGLSVGPRFRQRVPRREGRRGAALADPP